jgi:hypothetical protein
MLWAKVSSRIWRRNSCALDDDAAAMRTPPSWPHDEPQCVGVGGEVTASISLSTIACLRSAYSATRDSSSSSGTWKYSSAARAPLKRGLPDICVWYTCGVNAAGDHVVRSRRPRHSPSINCCSDACHAFSCGESTSTPSTSKIAP